MRAPGESAMVLVRALLRAASSTGVDPDVFCTKLGLSAQRIEEDASVPTAVLAHAWQLAPELSRDPLFGLHAGEHAELGSYDVIDYLFFTSATLEHALRSIERHQGILSDIWRIELLVEPGIARFRHWVPPDFVDPLRHAWDYFFSGALKRVRSVLDRGVTPLSVNLMHAAAGPQAEYERVFGCPVHFEQPVAEFVFDARLLSRPLVSSNPTLHRVIRRHAEDLLARVPSDRDVLARAHTLVPELLSNPKLSVNTLARKLGVSSRSLQRALAEHGTTYKELIDRAREELSVRNLQAATMSVLEVAASVGFDSQAAFTRAFRRWRGTTPTEFQRKARIGH